MSDDILLQIKGLKKSFSQDLFVKSQNVIANLSCDFPSGKCTGFMGHNGAGKTTTIKSIFGLIKPDKGSILFRGRPLSQEDKRSIGYMPEINKLPMNLTSHEILMNHLKIFKPKGILPQTFKDVVKAKLTEVELWEHRNKKVSKLSKGMGRRLSWSQATIHNPDLIILDEPFSGLDPLGRSLMARLIESIRNQKKTIILCTHELWSVNEICDELHILRAGELAYSTINPIHNQIPKPLFNYKLTSTGVDRKTIDDLRNNSNLPAWDYCQENNFLMTLGFDEYVDASRWLDAFVKNGVIIVNFERHRGFMESELIKYFSGAQK